MKHVVTMTIDDVEHYSDEEKAEIIAGYPEHEREARSKGIPQLGSGKIFPVAEERIKVEDFSIPRHFYVINGIDFGWDHPTACVQIVWDKESDIFYVTKIGKYRMTTVAEIAGKVRSWGQIPWSWPHDGLQHDKQAGIQIKVAYENEGLNMLDDRATFEDGGNSVEAGVLEMLDLMRNGQFFVFDSCAEDFLDEFRLYHRKDGKIVAENDDAISAVRYAYMMRRHSVPVGYRSDSSYEPIEYPDVDYI